MFKKYNLAKPEKYTKNGVEKTVWHNVGVLTEFIKDDGSISRLIEIPAIGLKINAFPIESKQTQETSPTQSTEQPEQYGPEQSEQINVDEIPF